MLTAEPTGQIAAWLKGHIHGAFFVLPQLSEAGHICGAWAAGFQQWSGEYLVRDCHVRRAERVRLIAETWINRWGGRSGGSQQSP